MVSLLSCSTDEPLPWVKVLGHGGGGFETPQNQHPPNTMESIEQAIFLRGADGVEVDIQMASDGSIWLFHDRRMESQLNDSGFVSSKKKEDLQNLRYRSGVSSLRKYKPVLLSEVLTRIEAGVGAQIISLNIQPQREVIDFEQVNQVFADSLFKITSEFAMSNTVIVECPDRDILKILVRQKPPSHGAQIFMTAPATSENYDFVISNGLNGFVSNYLTESEESMKRVKIAGLTYVLYGLKIRADIERAMELKPDMVQTDNIPLAIAILKP